MNGVLVVGDALLDVDVAGRVERTTPDAGLPVLDVTDEVERPGGAALAAALLTESGVPVTFVTALCADDAGRRLHTLISRAVDVEEGVPDDQNAVHDAAAPDADCWARATIALVEWSARCTSSTTSPTSASTTGVSGSIEGV